MLLDQKEDPQKSEVFQLLSTYSFHDRISSLEGAQREEEKVNMLSTHVTIQEENIEQTNQKSTATE